MEHLLVELRTAGIKQFIFVVGHHGETIREYFGDGDRWGIRIEYVTQRKQLGTAHALKLVERSVNDRCLLANGDVLVKAEDVQRVLAKDNVSISLIQMEDTSGLGVLEVSGERVVAIHEKVENPPTNLVNAGIYMITREVFPAIDRTTASSRGEYELTDTLQLMLDEGRGVDWVRIDEWLDVSYPWDLLDANEILMKGINRRNLGRVEGNVVIKGAVRIGRDTVVRANSYLVGPIMIGDNCEIGPNCYIRPSTAIGDNCHLGSAVEVKNSIIMRNTKIPHHNYVGDSVIGEDCNFGAGTKIANLRLDKQNVTVAGIDTRRRKLGAIVGDNVQTGINSSINIGSLIGDHTFIGPGAAVSGVVLPGSSVF
jgi:UDP-N-acetylglucosamine diphosphorylase/glucosamine-1-phosphate N-acetyltransferase